MTHIDEAETTNQLENEPNTRLLRVATNSVDGEAELVETTPHSAPEMDSESLSEGSQASEAPQSEEPKEQEAPPPDTNIRLKFLDDTQKLVGTWLNKTVGDFKR